MVFWKYCLEFLCIVSDIVFIIKYLIFLKIFILTKDYEIVFTEEGRKFIFSITLSCSKAHVSFPWLMNRIEWHECKKKIGQKYEKPCTW
jgi:hypothetical protein